MDARNIIEKLALAPHPEGGYYRRTYQCGQVLTPKGMPCGFEQPRPVSTAILFLLRAGQYSRLHRIRQDELWHFHLGGPLRLVWIDKVGRAREVILGPDIFNGQTLQFAVPGGQWFGATPAPGSGFSLVGCTVAPGFDFTDLHLARRHELERRFPLALDCIREFCPPDAPTNTPPEILSEISPHPSASASQNTPPVAPTRAPALDLPQHGHDDARNQEDAPLWRCKGRA
ncbi:cupin domain-containing protein [Desulfovibrio sp. 86]|uniref:DUF985 domain-containing protein n=1 Tax=uncultured Desulfovibrio sp. TaxID=167968 RepID=A0A212LAA6_9BACT|nr:cupin domain-containing protein [Desulfovibrio sp. 86]SCM74465.1 conserved hypothetical protein [uncultured Desulfovibrio sp.]VZH34851.1 conserved protein of unknown function [Desulfovibrio sp. 86]